MTQSPQDARGNPFIEVPSSDTALKNKKIPPFAKGLAIFGGSALTIGIALGVIEAVVGVGKLVGVISSALAALGPFLASAAAIMGAFLATPAGPFVLAAILGGVVVTVAIIVLIAFISSGSPTTRALDLVGEMHKPKKREELAEILRDWAANEKFDNFKNFFEGMSKEEFDQTIFFDNNQQGESVLSLLIEQQIEEPLALLREDIFDENNSVHKALYTSAIKFDYEGVITNQTHRFFTYLAMVNYPLAKECVKRGLDLIETNQGSETNPLLLILENDSQELFINAVQKEADVELKAAVEEKTFGITFRLCARTIKDGLQDLETRTL